jgi:hypothetical protein
VLWFLSIYCEEQMKRLEGLSQVRGALLLLLVLVV